MTLPTALPSVPPAASAELVFGRYQIIRRIAVGGMGEVFLARQSAVAGFDRLVILKSLLPDLAAQEDFVNQFLDEARVAATLNHPNIVSIYEVGLWNGTYFIAMEYIKGDNLSRLQRVAERAKKRIPHEVAAYIVHDAALALDHAHKATDIHGTPINIVHRDVSPQNIMVRTDGVTKVVDFGIAKAANRVSRTATGMLKGKVNYMAPEQVQGGGELDGRADQFALGVTLWEMLAGRKLFQGNNDLDVLRQLLTSPIPSLASVTDDIAPALADTVMRMIARNRDDRYPTLSEAAHDLKAFIDLSGLQNAQQQTASFVADTIGDEISAKTIDLTPSIANFVINLSPPPTQPTAAHMALQSRAGKKIGIGVGAAGALLLAVVAAAVILVPEPPPPPAVKIDAGAVAPPIVAPPVVAVPKPPRYLLDSVPTGATVTAKGLVLGTTPLDTDELAADVEHELEVVLAGYLPARTKVKLAVGDSLRDNVTLKKRPGTDTRTTPPPVQPESAKTGLLTLDAKPWVKVYVDGKYVDSTPISKVELSAGPHSVRLVNEGAGIDEVRKISITAGETFKATWVLKGTP